jgi:hypothetical protein
MTTIQRPEMIAMNAVFVCVTICRIILQIGLPMRKSELMKPTKERFAQRFAYIFVEIM